MACIPDSLLRFPMPIGPLNEPFGTDCYLTAYTAFTVIFWLVAVLSFLCALVMGVTAYH
jgi:hypothetical protein